jgi:hypothetical protein
MALLKLGSAGPRIAALQRDLKQRGFDPGDLSGQFTAATEAAVKAFQRSLALPSSGEAGPNTIAALRLPSVSSNLSPDIVMPMFPATPRANIQFHLPFVLDALLKNGMADKDMVLMALATIRAETAGFLPIEEFVSPFNTSPGGHPFDLYDNRRDLGNQGPPDGSIFRGRGFVQLTGRANYEQIGTDLGIRDQLLVEPDLANDPDVAAKIMVAFLRAKKDRIRGALEEGNLAKARELVNGGNHGIQHFEDAFQRGKLLIPDSVHVDITT